MATESAAFLASLTGTPIAELNPDISDPASRAVRGEVTITWPYNSVHNTYAFLVAEPDVRLRRVKGQVRVELRGPAAKAVAETALGGGDEVFFSLDGVKWTNDESPGRIPGARLQWQLEFSEKLNIQLRLGETGELKHISIDQPNVEQPTPLPLPEPLSPVLEPEPQVLEAQIPAPSSTPAVRKFTELSANEFASPALMKRARLSYGALFEGGLDIFEEDGGARNRGRKRSRFGRDSSAWRYTSQSRSPEPASPVKDAMEVDAAESLQNSQSPRPQMTDEACQTAELNLPSSVAVHARTDSSTATQDNAIMTLPQQQESTGGLHVSPEISAVMPSQELKVDAGGQRNTTAGLFGLPTSPVPVQQVATAESLRASSDKEPQTGHLDSRPATAEDGLSNTLFGTSKPVDSGFSMFGQNGAGQTGSNSSIADSVRFGFSHIPQNMYTSQSMVPAGVYPTAGSPPVDMPNYPDTYLASSRPPQYPDLAPYLTHPQIGLHQDEMGSQLPVTETFSRNQWDMATQSPSYDQVEGGHFGTDALDEGTRLTSGEAEARSDTIPPQGIPEGFSSYGNVTNIAIEDRGYDTGKPLPHDRMERSDFVKNGETYDRSEDEVGVEDEGEVEYDENGEEVEQGDYDQRMYNAPEDDDEGSFVEEDEDEYEAGERYGELDEIYDEEDELGSGEEWSGEDEVDEDDEDDDDDDGDGSEHGNNWSRLAPRAQPKPPVPRAAPIVISLLSDSEDDDAPPPPRRPPPQQATRVSSSPAPPPPQLRYEPAAVFAGEPSGQQAPNIAVQSQNHVQVVDFAQQPASAAQPRSSPTVEGEDVQDNEDSDLEPKGHENEPDHEPVHSSNSSSHGSQLGVEEGSEIGDPSKSEFFNRQPGDHALHEENDTSGEKRERADGEIPEHNIASSSEVSEEEPEDEHSSEDVFEIEEVASEDEPMSDAEQALDENIDDESMGANKQLQADEDPGQHSRDLEDQEMVETIPSPNDSGVVGQGAEQYTDAETVEEQDTEMTGVHASTDSNARARTASIERDNNRAVHPSSPSETQTSQLQTPYHESSRRLYPDLPRQKLPEDNHNLLPPTPMESQLTVEMVSQTVTVEDLELTESFSFVRKELESHTLPSFTEAEKSFEPLPQMELEQPRGSSVEGLVLEQFDSIKDNNTKPSTEATAEEAFGNPTEDSAEDARSPPNFVDTIVSAEGNIERPGVDPAMGDAQNTVHTDDSFQDDTTIVSTASMEPATADVGEQANPHDTRSRRRRSQARSSEAPEAIEDKITVTTPRNLRKKHLSMAQESSSPGSPDPSAQLARQAVGAKRHANPPEPLQLTRTSPRFTRARSSSIQMSATPDLEDSSTSLARAALGSPPKAKAKDAIASAASLKAELTKRLKTHRECVSLKSLRNYVEQHPTVLAVVTTQPPQPTRAKGGPREYVLFFNITDPSIGPAAVVEVQLYRPHKETLPTVSPGDAILLKNFQVKALMNKGFGLRSHDESAWAVLDGEYEDVPQIKGPPVEEDDWKQYLEHLKMLKAWWRAMDEGAKGKLERANKKLAEAGSSSQGK
ncbi:hypothetical protein OQA88_4691 [Cercophora sp. LCS_1]